MTLDSVKQTVGQFQDSVDTKGILNGDLSISENEGYSLKDLVADAIVGTHASFGVELTESTVGKALASVEKVLKEIKLDAVGSSRGRENVASIIGIHIISAISANLPFVGNLASFQSDNRKSTKAKIYYTASVATRDMGDILAGDLLDGVKALSPFAITVRHGSMLSVAGTTDYAFDLRAKEADTENTKMEIGRNSVMINGVELDDYEADSSAKITKRNKEEDGITYDAEFDYALGTIKLTVSEAKDGDAVTFVGALDRTDTEKVAGQLTTDVQDENYTTQAVVIDITSNALDVRETFANTGINIKDNSFGKAIEKVLHEVLGLELLAVRGLAVAYGTELDIAGNQRDTVAETFKPIVMLIDTAKGEMITDSGQAGSTTILGGAAVEKLVSALSLDSGNGVATKSKGMQNLVRECGKIRGDITVIFDPTHDEAYPVVDGVSTFLVINTPSEDLKKPVLSGIGLPLLPEGDIKDISANDNLRLSGTIIGSRNKNSKLSKQVKKITVRL